MLRFKRRSSISKKKRLKKKTKKKPQTNKQTKTLLAQSLALVDPT
jgi:hypothetical protein